MLAAIGFFLRFFETDLIRLVLLCQPIQYVQGRLPLFFRVATNVNLHFYHVHSQKTLETSFFKFLLLRSRFDFFKCLCKEDAGVFCFSRRSLGVRLFFRVVPYSLRPRFLHFLFVRSLFVSRRFLAALGDFSRLSHGFELSDRTGDTAIKIIFNSCVLRVGRCIGFAMESIKHVILALLDSRTAFQG